MNEQRENEKKNIGEKNAIEKRISSLQIHVDFSDAIDKKSLK